MLWAGSRWPNWGSLMFALGGGTVPLENPGLGITLTAVGCGLPPSLSLLLCPACKGIFQNGERPRGECGWLSAGFWLEKLHYWMSNEEQLSLGSQAGKTEFGTGRVTEWMVREAWWRPKQGCESHWGREGLRLGGVWSGTRFTHRENGSNIRTGWWGQTMSPMMNRGAYQSTMRGAGISFKYGMHNLVQGQNVLREVRSKFKGAGLLK